MDTAIVKETGTKIELLFQEIPSEDTVFALTSALEKGGFEIAERRFDGKTIVWTCFIPD